MDVMLIFGIIIGTVILFGAAGAAYWFYIKTRTKKISYKAKIWELTGSKMVEYDNKIEQKDIKSNLLYNLKPFATDIITRNEEGKGHVIYQLVKFNKVVPEIKAEHIQYWGKEDKVVHVLKDGDNFTLLRLGLDNSYNMTFQPMPYDLANMLTNQYYIKKERLKKEKDVFSAVTPWVVAIVVMVGMVGASYLFAEAWVKSSDSLSKSTEKLAEAELELTTNMVEMVKTLKSSGISSIDIKNKLGNQETEKTITANSNLD